MGCAVERVARALVDDEHRAVLRERTPRGGAAMTLVSAGGSIDACATLSRSPCGVRPVALSMAATAAARSFSLLTSSGAQTSVTITSAATIPEPIRILLFMRALYR